MTTSEKIKSLIVDRLSVKIEEVTDNASFKDDLGADSLDTVELIMELEKEFKLKIEDTEAEKITTVGDAIRTIENKLKVTA